MYPCMPWGLLFLLFRALGLHGAVLAGFTCDGRAIFVSSVVVYSSAVLACRSLSLQSIVILACALCVVLEKERGSNTIFIQYSSGRVASECLSGHKHALCPYQVLSLNVLKVPSLSASFRLKLR